MSHIRPSNARRLFREVGLFIADILYNAVVIIILVIFIRGFLISPFRVIGSSMSDTLQSNEFILIDKLSYHLSEPQRGDPVVFRPPITSKYSYKFQESVESNENGEGVLDLTLLRAEKPVIYCHNKIMASFWFCREPVEVHDIAYILPASYSSSETAWKQAEEHLITQEEIKQGQLIFKKQSNQSYSVRIYDSLGPEYFVKRIIGIPGDEIKIENGRVYLKTSSDDSFRETNEIYLNQENQERTYFNQNPAFNTFVVPNGHYFLLGDNRQHSNDSRSWFAPINQEPTPYATMESISGKVLVVLWPPNAIRLISGESL